MEKREKGGSAIRVSAEHQGQNCRDFIYPDAREAKSNQTQTEMPSACLPHSTVSSHSRLWCLLENW